jgi:glycosyltransferase involved in cell wall biosynthesis
MTPHPRRPIALFLPSLEGGGAERVMLNLAAGLAKRGFRIDLVLAQVTGEYLRSVPRDVRVVDLRASRVFFSLCPLGLYLRRERPLALLSALDHANLVAMSAARLARTRTRTVISIHCTVPRPLRTGIRARLIPWLLGRLHSWADGVVAVSEGVADSAARATGIPVQRFSVIYNPVITPGLAAAASARPSHPWFEDRTRPIVLGAGRLTAQKNFPLLISAFALVARQSDVRLVILGDGPARPALEAHIRRHGLEHRIALPGFVTNPYACMARARVFALSSDFEGLPTVLIESLAVGTPVVSTDCASGPREILRGGALGELVPVGDVTALAQAISHVLAHPPSSASFEALRPFTLDPVLDQFQEVLDLGA